MINFINICLINSFTGADYDTKCVTECTLGLQVPLTNSPVSGDSQAKHGVNKVKANEPPEAVTE